MSLPNRQVARVVDYHDDDIGTAGFECLQFLNIHLQAAITGKTDHAALAARISFRRADGCRQIVSHRSRT
jgi:hypothetical protein